MPTDFTLPELGENIAGGDVVRMLVAAGDSVTKDQPVLELETDKATIEVPSSVSGTVREVKIKQGERVKVGQVILTLDNGARPGQGHRQRRRRREAQAPAGRGRGRGGCSREMPGAATAQPVPAPVPAPAPEPKPKRGEVVDIRGGARAAQAPPPPEVEPQGPAAPAAPSVRRLARELGVDIRRVAGSGPAGRISLDDVQAFVRNALAGVDSRECAVIAARLHQVGRRRAQADEQHPPQDGRASGAAPGTPSRTSRSTTRPTSPRSRPCASSTARRPRRPAAS